MTAARLIEGPFIAISIRGSRDRGDAERNDAFRRHVPGRRQFHFSIDDINNARLFLAIARFKLMQKSGMGLIMLCASAAVLSACGESDSAATLAASSGVSTSAPSAAAASPPPAPTTSTNVQTSPVKLSAETYSVAAAAGKAVIDVERTGKTGATAIKYSTADGSGVDGVDYTSTAGTLNWSDGDASVKRIYVPVASRSANKTFKVSLTPAKNDATLSTPKAATVTITAPAEQIPPGAELAGYKTRTFGPSLKMGSNWHDMTFFGWSGTGGKNNSDGTVTISGHGSGTISTAKTHGSKAHHWEGMAFGGGAYFEAEFSFANADNKPLGIRWPAFWANDIENMAENEVNELTQWYGQPKGYGNWIETDFFEYDLEDLGEYGVQMHNWYAYHEPGKYRDVPAFSDPVKVPAGFRWSDTHKYGFLWVPATATSKGFAQAYLDDVPVGKRVSWNKYNPKAPPSPVEGSSAWSVIDTRHMAMILDTGPKNPMTVHSVSVWQESKENNLTQ